MKVHYPKLYNMAHLLSLNVFTASKGSNNYIYYNFRTGECPTSMEIIIHCVELKLLFLKVAQGRRLLYMEQA